MNDEDPDTVVADGNEDLNPEPIEEPPILFLDMTQDHPFI